MDRTPRYMRMSKCQSTHPLHPRNYSHIMLIVNKGHRNTAASWTACPLCHHATTSMTCRGVVPVSGRTWHGAARGFELLSMKRELPRHASGRFALRWSCREYALGGGWFDVGASPWVRLRTVVIDTLPRCAHLATLATFATVANSFTRKVEILSRVSQEA